MFAGLRSMTMTKLYMLAALGLGLLLPALSPPAYAALEKSSKKECAVCHVMWLDVFRTKKETLIKWQPGNVLMKDTQGIVSAEEVCYSCHDGYVFDSRYTAWKNNNHPVFKKPSPKVKIHNKLTLSNKDEIYCGTCHTPHSGLEEAAGLSAAESIAGPLRFLRLSDVDSGLCEACHVNEADFHRTNGHPVHTDKLKIPETLFARGGRPASKKDTLICQTCHAVHGAEGSRITVMDNRQSALCMACHKERSIAGTLHDVRRTMPAEKNLRGQPVSESGPCGACHVPHNSAGYKLWARKRQPGNPASQACLSCHAGDPESKIKSIGRYSHSIDIAAVPKTQGQAAPAPSKINLPSYSPGGRLQAGGSLQCATCHQAHQWDPNNPENKGEPGIPGDADNSFLRISAGCDSALCVACHLDKRQISAFDHNLDRTAPQAENIRGQTAAGSGPCGACHLPHNAADKRLWARWALDQKTGAQLYCTGCHAPNGTAHTKQVGKNDHPVDIVLKGKGIPLIEGVTGKLPLYNAKGGTQDGDRIMCRTCHDPHIWSAGGGTADPADGSSGDKTDAAVKTIEGDARTSFLRKAASPAPDLCGVCHEDSTLLVGTDHDLFVTAPSAKNLFDQTVIESGQCGVCHAAHNSPKDRLLWARDYGPVEKGQHPMNALCTGCHSESGSAKDKVPPVATHPEGKLINNIFTFTDQPTGYIKIFDDHWKEVQAGNLSCSSCHSFNQWDHRIKKQGPGKKVEGNADTSFLRASSDKIVCTDCHGQSALWRYLYFHSVQKRAMLKGVRP